MQTKIKAELILASKNVYTGDILWTFELTYPRIILAEVNTHRMLSRNTSSSRAIPSARQRARVLDDPFLPISIGEAKKGMQAGEELEGWRRWLCEKIWLGCRYPNVVGAWAMDALGAHKQVSNRLIEPWTWTKQLVTATDLANLLYLRNNDMAEPHFHEVARQIEAIMLKELYLSKDYVPDVNGRAHVGGGQLQYLYEGDWHLPYLDWDMACGGPYFYRGGGGTGHINLEEAKQVSSAICGRLSYSIPGSTTVASTDSNIAMTLGLVRNGHWSPLEHVATPMKSFLPERAYYGNFRGWKQYRKEFLQENGNAAFYKDRDPKTILASL